MILTDLIFLIILTNALTGALYLKVWSAVSGCLEEKSDYISIYRWLRLGLLFYILPGLAVVFAGGFRALAAGMGQSEIFSPMKMAVFFVFAAALIWVAGAAVSVCRYIREIRSFCRICKHNIEIEDKWMQEYFVEICKRQDIYKSVSVYENTEITVPVIFGICRRQILLPSDGIGAQDIRMILEHEMVHVKHHDLLVERLAAIISLICWFLPQPKRMLAAMEDWSETVCDISVCASDVSVWPIRQYFDLVVRCAGEAKGSEYGTVMALGGGESSAIRTRILRMKRFTRYRPAGCEAGFLPRRRSSLLALGLSVFAAFLVWQAGRQAVIQVTTDHLVSHTALWSGVRADDHMQLRGSRHVWAGSSGYRLVYLKEKGQIRIAFEASAICPTLVGSMDEDMDMGVFGSIYIYRLFEEPQTGVPATLGDGSVDYVVQDAGWYVVRWDNALTDTGVTVDYVITR
ncbi:MAG: M56 family metallopeptidase [Lachnospiraceae bacterium]|nr:M56 family metallopeptidase [Lachnospiraceae bacterium]